MKTRSSPSTSSSSCGTASPTVVSDGRLRTTPNAPSSLCSTTSTTVRQKLGSTSDGPAISRCPRAESITRGAEVRARTVSQPERPPQDLFHDLVRSAPDRTEARVASGALDLVFADVAGAAVDLQAGVHDLERRSL